MGCRGSGRAVRMSSEVQSEALRGGREACTDVQPVVVRMRRAVAGDLDELVRVTDEARRALGDLGIDQWQGGTPRLETLKSDIEQGNTWLAVDEQDGAVLGCMAFCLGGEPDYDNVIEGAWLTDSPNCPGEAGPTYACVHRVAVSSAARRKHVAVTMFSHAKDLAEELQLVSVRVDTHAGNIPMQRLLDKNGYKRCCTILITLAEEPTKERIGYELVM